MTVTEALASRLNVKPGQIRRLKNLAEQAANAQTEEHNTPNAPDSTPAINAVEKYAKSLGYDVMWPGLYPILVKDGNQFHIY